jgi:hypothetical protein
MLKLVLLAIVAIILLALAWSAQPEPPIKAQPEWCFFARYDSMKDFNQAERPADRVFIKLNGNKPEVYVKCD